MCSIVCDVDVELLHRAVHHAHMHSSNMANIRGWLFWGTWVYVCSKCHENRSILKPVLQICVIGCFLLEICVHFDIAQSQLCFKLESFENGKQVFCTRPNVFVLWTCEYLLIGLTIYHLNIFLAFLNIRVFWKVLAIFFYLKKGSLKDVKLFLFSSKNWYFFLNNSWKGVIFYMLEHMCTHFTYESHHRDRYACIGSGRSGIVLVWKCGN